MDPTTLPIYRYERAILDALAEHRVIVLEGPTGSGKTTQLPKILLRGGLDAGVIGVTQPRRIAAVSVAWRIAEELGVPLGHEVGYAIRFDDRTGPETVVKIMTDGILLMEARTDSTFSRYGVIVVDEAHERTLNIDFTLGLLHRALRRRPDLRVVVSSATLQPETFQRYFRGAIGEVPVISIDARPFPVDIVYRPTGSESPDAVMEGVRQEVMAIHRAGEAGAILVFLTGEAMIKGTRDLLERQPGGRDLLVMPLYGKLTREEQEQVFRVPERGRKVVLATNIAETSITVPDVRYVVDTGLAKVPRVHNRTGITTLREEGISRASAEQRAGRAGRTAPGRAVRLYAKRAFMSRPAYTDEEILRLDLSDVVLRLINLGIHDIEDFPLPTAPPRDALQAALDALMDMGAIDSERRLTRIGERMMPFPLTPALARMVVEAAENHPDVVDETLIVGAFLSARPPFLYPQGEESEARAAQDQLAHPLGDALTAVQTLRRYRAARNTESFCAAHYLDPNIMAFIDKAHGQLSEIAGKQGVTIAGGGDPTRVIRCVARGFARQILRGSRGHTYEGPGDVPVAIHPSSSVFGARAPFVVAAEIVVSTRAYARFVSLMRPEWVPEANPELARRWGLNRRRRDAPEADATRRPMPRTLELGEVSVPVVIKRGRPTLFLAAELLPSLQRVSLTSVPRWALPLRTQIEHGRMKWGQSASLAEVLCLLPHLPIPEGEPERIRDVPQGALLESDRNQHTLARFVDRVLSPGLPQRGKHPGWLTLISNGETGFWFEVIGDYPDAVATTLESLRDLIRAVPPGDPLHTRLEALEATVEERALAVTAAMDAARRATRGG